MLSVLFEIIICIWRNSSKKIRKKFEIKKKYNESNEINKFKKIRTFFLLQTKLQFREK